MGARELCVAAVQFACLPDPSVNIATAVRLAHQAADQGARLIVLPELFERPYFCQQQRYEHLDYAGPPGQNSALDALRKVAASRKVILPVSLYELAGQARFNSLAMLGPDGAVAGIYRKSHIPDGPGYCEKFHFSPGDSGFRVFAFDGVRIGTGICWDQWFPEAARIMALMGAEVLIYPTAIGSEPDQPDFDSSAHWRRVMQGHAGANLMPVIAANRTGTEVVGGQQQTYYGSSFITDEEGAIVADAPREGEAVILARFDLDRIAARRRGWGVFRDRRPDLYGPLLTLDGQA